MFLLRYEDARWRCKDDLSVSVKKQMAFDSRMPRQLRLSPFTSLLFHPSKFKTNAEVEVVFGRRVRPTDFIAVVRRDSRCSKKDCRLGATSWCCINA